MAIAPKGNRQIQHSNILQALRIEKALSLAEATMRHMGKDRNVATPQWNQQCFVQDARQTADMADEVPAEGFSFCCQLLEEPLPKLLLNGGQGRPEELCEVVPASQET